MLKFDTAFMEKVKSLGFVMIILFTSFKTISQTYPVDTLMRNGVRANRINLVYLSDGYQSGQLATYIEDATTINNALFSQTPFLEYKNYFNSYAIKVPSPESGAKHPGTAADEASSGGQPVINPNNNYESTFDYASIHRLLVPQDDASIYSALASNLPDYSQAFIVVNSPYYGGSGGSFATASTDPSSAEVAIHEIGHSFAYLADEYWAGDNYAAEKPNMTMDADPTTVKWKNWIGINGIGIYPYGDAGTAAQWYKPHLSCKMQYLGYPFCSVCAERFVDVIHQKVSMIDTNTPASTSFTLADTSSVDFSVAAVETNPSTIGIKWYLNASGAPFSTNQYSVTIPFSAFHNGNNQVRAELTDSTGLSKSYLPGIGYINNLTWTVNKPSVLPIHITSFSGSVNNDEGSLNWNIDAPADVEKFELEKSRDGINFTGVTSVAAEALQKSYHYNDEKLFAPDTYYRLDIVDKNGASYYSNIIRLQNASDKFFYKVYQDADVHKYHLSVGINELANVSFKIIDVSGKIILKKDFGKADKQIDYDFDLARVPAGIYFMALNFNHYNYTIQLIAK